MERQQRNTISNTKTQTIFNKEFTLFFRAMSPVQLQWWPFFIVSFSREITMQGLNMSSPKANFAWQGGSRIPQATQSTQTLVLPTSSVTLGLQWKEPMVMLNPDKFLYGKA